METIELKNPIKVNGKTVNELTLDLDGVDCEGYCQAEHRARSMTDWHATVIEMDYAFALQLGVQAVLAANPGWDASDVERVTGSDVSQLMRLGRFLAIGSDLSQGEDDGSQESSSEKPSESTQGSTGSE